MLLITPVLCFTEREVLCCSFWC